LEEKAGANQPDRVRVWSDEEEAKCLIASIKTLKISSDTQSELDDYEQDIINNEIVFMDLRYLRSLKERLK